jgi:hypothetical protein
LAILQLPASHRFFRVHAARQWLQQRQLRPFRLVHESIKSEFEDFDQRDPNAVLIADAADGFSYRNLNHAFQLCMAGAPLLGVGKPNLEFFRQVIASTSTQAERTLMVGDEDKISGDFYTVDSIAEAVDLALNNHA